MPTVTHPLSFYLKIAVPCFAIGAAMEAFMIRTGFYTKVVEIEAERLEENREERTQFYLNLKNYLAQEAAKGKIKFSFPENQQGNQKSS